MQPRGGFAAKWLLPQKSSGSEAKSQGRQRGIGISQANNLLQILQDSWYLKPTKIIAALPTSPTVVNPSSGDDKLCQPTVVWPRYQNLKVLPSQNRNPGPKPPGSGAGFPAAEKQEKGSIKTYTGVKAGLNLEMGHTGELSQYTGDRKLVPWFAPY